MRIINMHFIVWHQTVCALSLIWWVRCLLSAAVHWPVCVCRDGCHLSPPAIGVRIFGNCADWWNPLGGGVSPGRQAQGHSRPGATPEGVWAVCWQWVTMFVLKRCMFNGVKTTCEGKYQSKSPAWQLAQVFFFLSLLLTDSCCTEEDIQDISHVPSAINKNEPWDKCGPLSSE